MFSAREGLELVIDQADAMQEIDRIMLQFPNPEDINNDPNTAPSKRLKAIYHYDKTADAALIFELITIEDIMEKCPRFRDWIARLVEVLREQAEPDNHSVE